MNAFHDTLRDLRHAWRTVCATPVLAIVIVVSLAAGIGVNTVVFSWIQARVLEPLPGVPDGRSLRLVEARTDDGVYPGTSWLEYEDLRTSVQSFRDLVAFNSLPAYVGETGRVERVFASLVPGNYFTALGVRPFAGRLLEPGDVSRPGGEPVAVISHALWQRHLGGAADAIGREIRVNGRQLTVIGIAPDEFQGTVLGLQFDLWLPATLAPVVAGGSRELEDRSIRTYSLLARLHPRTSQPQAQAELDAVMARLAQSYPATNSGVAAELLPQWSSPRGPQRLLTTALVVLQGIMLLLLLAVCGNTSNLVLARASARRREVGIRIALGASPWRIVRLLLAETTVLSLAGAAIAVPVAIWGTQAFRLLPLTGLPLRFQTDIDLAGLSFAVGLGLLCGLLIGAVPAIQLARFDPQLARRPVAGGTGRSRIRSTLMAIQVALALVVLIVAGLFFRSLMDSRSTDPGFRREGVLLAAYDLSGRNPTPEAVRDFAARLLTRVRNAPGIQAAAIAVSVPLDIHGLPSRAFTLQGYARTEPGADRALTNIVSAGYFDVMEIPLRAGSDFADLSDQAAPPQAIVNEAFVRRYLDDLEPIGRRVEVSGRTHSIVGVVADSVSNAFGEPPTPVIYLSYRDNLREQAELHVRTRTDTEASAGFEIRRIVRELDPEVPVFNVRTLSEHIDTNLVFRRVPARMFAFLGPMLLVLAAIGIYAVVAYSVSLRTTEIGVRVALGATRSRVAVQIMLESFRAIGAGAAAGWLLAFAVAMHAAHGTSPGLPVFAGIPAVLLLVAAAACWIPIRRATRVDPVVALRHE